MSATVKTNNVSWRKRRREEDKSTEIQLDWIKPRYYYYRLESESSKGSEEDTESIYSVQDRETDVIRDTSDTNSKPDGSESYEWIEYEVASLSGSESGTLGSSTSGSDDQMIVAAAIGAVCDSSIETWITDGEDSDNSSLDSSFPTRVGFVNCVQCRSLNDNPLYRYCEKCFQDRKKFYPPRPRGNKKLKRKIDDPAVKLDTLRSCLSGLSSQDSGIGSSQECPVLDLDQIVVPNKHLQSGTSASRKRQASESSLSEEVDVKKPRFTRPKSRSSRPSSRNSAKDEIPLSKEKTIISQHRPSSFEENNKLFFTKSFTDKSQDSTDTCLSQSSSTETLSLSQPSTSKEFCSSSSLETFSSQPSTSKEFSQTSDYGSEISASSLPGIKLSDKSLTSSQNSDSVSDITSNASFNKSQSTELCIICNEAPQNSIFLHTYSGHQCCCYKCAKRTLHTIKRCPLCNRTVNKVIKIFKA